MSKTLSEVDDDVSLHYLDISFFQKQPNLKKFYHLGKKLISYNSYLNPINYNKWRQTFQFWRKFHNLGVEAEISKRSSKASMAKQRELERSK